MFSLKSVGSVGCWALLFSLALVPQTTALAQSRDDDPRTPGGRSISPPIDTGAVEQLWQDATERSLAEEKKSLAKDESWLTSQYREQEDNVKKLSRLFDNLDRRKLDWRCSAGCTLENCSAHPAEVAAFRGWYNTETDRLDGLLRRVRVAKKRLDDLKSSFETRRRAYDQKLSANRNSSAKKSKRSPDEGLFIDESAPRR